MALVKKILCLSIVTSSVVATSGVVVALSSKKEVIKAEESGELIEASQAKSLKDNVRLKIYLTPDKAKKDGQVEAFEKFWADMTNDRKKGKHKYDRFIS